MTSPERLDGFLTELGPEEAATFTAVRGGDEDAMIRLFGGDPERARPMNLEKLRDHYDKDQILVSGSGPAVVAVENNAYHARFYQRTAEPSQVLMVYPWSDRASQSGSAEDPPGLEARDAAFDRCPCCGQGPVEGLLGEVSSCRGLRLMPVLTQGPPPW